MGQKQWVHNRTVTKIAHPKGDASITGTKAETVGVSFRSRPFGSIRLPVWSRLLSATTKLVILSNRLANSGLTIAIADVCGKEGVPDVPDVRMNQVIQSRRIRGQTG